MAASDASSASAVEEINPPLPDLTEVDRILEQHHSDSTELIAILLDSQDALGYLPIPALRHISEKLEFPITEIYGIATFYKHFKLTPPPKHQFTVCTGTACHVRGAMQVLREFERQLDLDISISNTTPDMECGLETVNCIGACALGPVVIVDGEFKGQVNQTRVSSMIRTATKASGGDAE